MHKVRSVIVVILVATSALIGSPVRAVTLPEDVEIDQTLSPRPVGTFVGGQTVLAVSLVPPTEREAAAPAPIKCSLDNDGSMIGDRTASGLKADFKYFATSVCSSEIVELDVQAALKHDGNVADTTPHGTCRACVEVTTGVDSDSCFSGCHGVWRIESTHVFALPAGFVLIDYDRGRCSMTTPLQMTCVVRSNKVRI